MSRGQELSERKAFDAMRQQQRDDKGKTIAMPDDLKKLIHAEVEFRFMVQLCFMQPYQDWMKDQTIQLQMLDWKVAQRLRGMQDNIDKLRLNAFGKDQL